MCSFPEELQPHGPSCDALSALLYDPPREYTPLPFWFWNDDLTEVEIVRQIDAFLAHEVYGFVIHPRLGLPRHIGFPSERYFALVRFAVEQAAVRGMIVHLYDEGMYPSGSACGRVVSENPHFAARCLLARELPPDAPPAVADGEYPLAEMYLPSGVHVQIIDAPSFGRIRGVHEGQDDGQPDQPYAADLLNPEAVASFLRHVYEGYYRVCGEYFGTTIRAIFTDEPDMLGRGHRPHAHPWTTGLEAYLNERLGYDVVPYL